MADTIQLYLMENRSIKAEFNNRPYAYEGGINIVAGEINATQFEIKSVPARLKDATITLEMYNALNVQVQEPEIKDNIFMLPAGMAVAGYGQFIITLTLNKEKVVFLPFKIKVANTRRDWQQYTITTVPLEIGATTTIAAGKQAKVENVGSKDFPILNFYIPQGEKGEKGDTPIIDNLLDNKNLYNLGAYDTFVSNGDGTVTITRKTGYIVLNGSESWETWNTNYGQSAYLAITPIPCVISAIGSVGQISAVANGFEVRDENYTWGAQHSKAIAFEAESERTGTNRITVSIIGINSGETAKQYFSETPCYIQYELETPYIEQVIENQPIHTLNQDGEQWVRDEWEKGLNLATASNINLSFIKGQNRMQVIDAIPVTVGTEYCIQFSGSKSSSESWDLNGFGGWIALFWDSPYFSGSYSEAFLSSSYRYETEQVNVTLSVTAEKPYLLIIIGNEGRHQLNININNLMINKGSIPYPYKPYYGELTRNGVKRTGDTMTGGLNAPVFGQSDPNKDYVDFAGGTGKNFGIGGENGGIYNLAHMLRKNDFYTSIKSSVSVSSNTSANINRVASVTATNNSPCLLTVFGVETAQHGALMISSNTNINSSWSNDNNNGSNILAKAEGEQGYWSKQYLCCSALIPPNQTVYVYARYLEKIRYTLQPIFSL